MTLQSTYLKGELIGKKKKKKHNKGIVIKLANQVPESWKVFKCPLACPSSELNKAWVPQEKCYMIA